MYKLSIVIPVYGVEKYLPKCLDSVYSQIAPDCQVILVDDASPDRCPEICEEYKARYPESTVVIHQENMGLGGARNTGISAAEGEYIIFLDSDDWYAEGTIAALYTAIEHYNADVYIFPFRAVGEGGEDMGVYADNASCNIIFKLEDNKHFLTGHPNACTKMFRLSLFKESGISFPSRVWYEDIRTVPKILTLSKSIVFLEKVMYNYLRRDGSITNNAKVDRNIEIVEALDDLISWFKKEGVYEQYREELDYLMIDHVFVSATVRVLRSAGKKHPLVKTFREYTKNNCTTLKTNKYIATMPRNRRLIYKLLLSKLYFAVQLIFKIKG